MTYSKESTSTAQQKKYYHFSACQKIKYSFSARLLMLILCMAMMITVSGCGKKKPTQPSEQPVEGASVIELPVDNGAAADTSAAAPEQATEQTSQLATAQATGQNSVDSISEQTSQTTASSEHASQTTAPSEQASQVNASSEQSSQEDKPPAIDEAGVYTKKDDVALYIHTYGKLPSNFITKKAAKKLGWSGGSLEDYAPGKCIGGDYFGNYEGLLPEDKEYHECDIDTLGKNKRGAKRIIYSDDGYIYYTGDHYESFELLFEPKD